MNNPLLLIVVAALFFSAWPLIAKFANLSFGWLTLLLAIGTAFVALTQVSKDVPTTRQIIIVLIAGLANGLGTLVYAKLLTSSRVEVSRFIPLTLGLIAVITLIAGFLLFKEPLTLKKIIGVLLVGIAIYLLN